ncbi:hypothetical protein HAX54_020857 [Datura stramonium]|uniref:Uncharacterized protein n=1 Tax=Datura stramonium TaxID=4076 RepID=A0ABS8UU44_DATST|nr:hypothetical protein [Datura stramonium]
MQQMKEVPGQDGVTKNAKYMDHAITEDVGSPRHMMIQICNQEDKQDAFTQIDRDEAKGIQEDIETRENTELSLDKRNEEENKKWVCSEQMQEHDSGGSRRDSDEELEVNDKAITVMPKATPMTSLHNIVSHSISEDANREG